MPRPQRLLFPYGVWHLASRGVDGRVVFMDDDDRRLFLIYLCRFVREFGWTLHVYCLMGNHFHLIVECGQPALSHGMERLNGAYATHFNARHRRVGHLFQRRFESWPIEDDAYLENAISYVRNNPVCAGLCSRADAWPWSGGLRDLERYALPPLRPSHRAPRALRRAADARHELVVDRPGDARVLLGRRAGTDQRHGRPGRLLAELDGERVHRDGSDDRQARASTTRVPVRSRRKPSA